MKNICPTLRFGSLVLAGAALAVLSANAQVTNGIAPNGSASEISKIEVSQAGPQTSVRISGTGELQYRTSRMDGPPRLVLDFTNTRLGMPQNKVASEFAPVQDVRIGQSNTDTTRVVIDLAQRVPFSVKEEGSSLTVSFAESSTSNPPATSTVPLVVKKNTTTQRIVSVKAPAMPLPAWLTGNSLTFARPSSEPSQPVPQDAPSARAANPMADRRFTGDPISVNLKDVDLKDFFRLIHEISGLNVVLDPAVRGTVTLVLDEVPWDQALDIVLRNNGLTKEIDGNVLRIATQETLKHEADQRRDLIKAQSDAIDTVTVTRVLSYAQANTVMATTLKRFLTPRGDVYPDVRSNTLIIRDIPASIPKIDELIRQLDRKSQQVEIDARVVQASRSFARELGTQLAYSFGATHNVIGGASAVGTSPIFRPYLPGISTSPALIAGTPPVPPSTGLPTAANVAMPLATNLGATAATSGLSYLFTSSNFALDFMLTAMESRGVGKILSEPKGITQNNEKLTVKQGSQIPIQTNVNNTVTVQFIDAVLKLEVTPQITMDGTVFLDITVENTQIDQGTPRIQGTPALNTQSTQTKVLVNDGGTVVIGGVVVNNSNTSINQVPLLGGVPLIGNLFKHTTINITTEELMFFVTPRILPG